MRSKNHQYARLYAKHGFRIFPLIPRDKRPLTKSGFKDATDELASIERWWIANTRAGIGLPTGKVNGIIVVDLDPRNTPADVDRDGVEHQRDAWQMAHDLFGETLPDTWIVETPGGGLHFYFRHPGEHVLPGLKGWKPGIDVKSDGGYVCAPPSIHPNGGVYTWTQAPDAGVPLAELPEFVYAAMQERQRKTVERELAGPTTGKIPAGNRNDALASLAGTMQRRGMDPEAILAALLAENQAKCEPPLPEAEVVNVVASISRYEPDEQVEPSKVIKPTVTLEIDSISELLNEPPPIDWLIPKRLARGDCALIVGPPGSGKSWITLDIAISGALGHPILSHWEIDRPIKVMYVDEENPRDEVNRRLWCIFNATVSNGARPDAREEVASRLFIYRPCQGFTFRERDGYLASLARQVSQIEPDLIVFDSVTAVSGITDENKATEVRGFFHDKLYPLRRVANSAILCVHHSNKRAYETEGNVSVTQDGQIRGSIDYLAAVDSCLFANVVKNKEGTTTTRWLHQTKQRRDAAPPPLEWGLVPTPSGGVRPQVLQGVPLTAQPIDAGRCGDFANKRDAVCWGWTKVGQDGTIDKVLYELHHRGLLTITRADVRKYKP